MNKKKFEDWCSRYRVSPERKMTAEEAEVYIGDSRVLCPPSSEYHFPHYRTLWAVSRGVDDVNEVAQVLYFGPNESDKELRIAAAVKTATQWLEDMNAKGH